MEWIILLAIICAYSSLSSKIDDLKDNQNDTKKKDFPSLSKLLGKTVSISIADDSCMTATDEPKGILKDYNDKWLVIEKTDKKGKKFLYYYRLKDVTSIDFVEKDA